MCTFFRAFCLYVIDAKNIYISVLLHSILCVSRDKSRRHCSAWWPLHAFVQFVMHVCVLADACVCTRRCMYVCSLSPTVWHRSFSLVLLHHAHAFIFECLVYPTCLVVVDVG